MTRSAVACVALSCAALCALGARAASPDMQPGMWEITTRMEMPGMPVAVPPQLVRHCYTKKDLEDGKNAVPSNKQDPNCRIKDYALKGNTATWSMECTGENAMSGTGTMTFAASSYSGSMKTRIKQGGQTMDMMQSWTGRRVGDCK